MTSIEYPGVNMVQNFIVWLWFF